MFLLLSDQIKRGANSAYVRHLRRSFPRRVLVLALGLWLFVMAWKFPQVVGNVWLLAIMDLTFVALAASLVLSIYGLFELPDTHLDEQQLQVRNAAYKTAYGFTLIFSLVVMVLAFGFSLSRQQTFGVVLMSFLTICLAPRAFAAWQLDEEPCLEA